MKYVHIIKILIYGIIAILTQFIFGNKGYTTGGIAMVIFTILIELDPSYQIRFIIRKKNKDK